MAEGFVSKQSDILSWIHSVEAASPDPPQDELDWGLTSNPDSYNMAHPVSRRRMDNPASPRGHQALDNLRGHQAMDSLRGHQALDNLRGHQAMDNLRGHQALDNLRGHQAMDNPASPRGHQATDNLRGHQALDNLRGHQAMDSLRGHQALDNLRGHQAMDNLRGHQAMDNLRGHQAMDNLRGHQSLDNPRGHQAMDSLRGHQAMDNLRGHQALDKHLSAPASVPARPRGAKPSPRGSRLDRAASSQQSTAKTSQIKVKHVRQKSLSPLPDPTQRLDLPDFSSDICRDKRLFEPKPPLLGRCPFNKSLPAPGRSVPKSKLLRVTSDLTSSPQPRSAPVSPDLGFRRKQVVPGAGVRPPLRRGELIREKSYSHDNLMKVEDFTEDFSDVSDRGSSEAAPLSDYNVSTVHSGDEEGTGRDASVRVTPEPSPSLTVAETTHTGQASLTSQASLTGQAGLIRKEKSAESETESGCNSKEYRRLQEGSPETLCQLQDPDCPPVATSPSPPLRHTSTVTPTPPEKITLSPTSTEDKVLFAMSAKSPAHLGWKQQQHLSLPPSSPVVVRQHHTLSSPSSLGWKQQRSSSSSPSPTESPAHKTTPLSHQKLQQLQLLEKTHGFQFLGEEELAAQPTIKFLSKKAPTGTPSRLHPTPRRPSDYSSVSSASSSSGTEGVAPRRSSAPSEELITERRPRLEKRELQLEKSGPHAGQMKSESSFSLLTGRRALSQYPTTSPRLVRHTHAEIGHTHSETDVFPRQQHQKEHVSRQDSGIGTLSSSAASWDFR